MTTSPLAGKPAPREPAGRRRGARARLLRAQPDPGDPSAARRLRHQRPSRLAARRGSSTRRTSSPSPRRSASTAAAQGIDGPLFMGKDTHALSARRSARRSRCSRPTASRRSSSATTASRRRRSISRAILAHNRGRKGQLADGIVITPSHNPPEDGGFKYNPPNGGPADTDVTAGIETAPTRCCASGNAGVKRVPLCARRQGGDDARRTTSSALRRRPAHVVDMDAIRDAGLKLGGRSARRRRACTTGSRSRDSTGSTSRS